MAVCDVYGPRVQAAAEKTGGKIYRNYKELLADPRVDVVCIATPDRHHAPQAIDAVRAGKDVYCEKPLTHWSQMDLARQLGEEAEKHKRIVQVGTQYVADDAYAEVRKLIQDGIVGKIVHVQAGYFRRGDWGERMPIPDPNAKPGPDLDWEQFLGDAPKVDFSVSRFFQWRMYWDYAGGPATDLLVHVFTPVFCLLGPRFPRAGDGRRRHVPVQPRGARPVQHHRRLRRRAQRGADELAVQLRAASTRSSAARTASSSWDDIDHLGREQGRADRAGSTRRRPRKFIPWQGAGDTAKLWSNFLDCVKSRQKPYSPIDIAVRVQAPLNMGILSHREARWSRFDKQKMSIVL